MPKEKKALYPLLRDVEYPLHPEDWQPNHSVEYRVKDLDTWESVAQRFNVDVDNLVRFNFVTNDPDEVNWYLKRYVGRVSPSPSGLNWAFNRKAKPGKIYIPITKFDMDPMKVTGQKTISPLALEFEGPSSPLDKIGKVFDGIQMVDIGLAVIGTEFAAPVMLALGIATAPFALFVAMGGL